jgi:hypothetical protein
MVVKDTYAAEINDSRAKRVAYLISNYSPAALIVIENVKPGTHTIGSEASNDICIVDSPSCPAFLGSLCVADKMIFTLGEGVEGTLNGVKVERDV